MIEIIASGALCSIQDEGRTGFRRFGVSTAGAMDRLAYRTANVLVGNGGAEVDTAGTPHGAAAIEVTVYPFIARFLADCRIAVTGACGAVWRDGRRLPPWWSFEVTSGQTVKLDAPQSGVRTYLAIRATDVKRENTEMTAETMADGGVEVPLILGSRSTDIKGGFGGYKGRCLKRGDIVPFATVRTFVPRPDFGVLPPDDGMTGAARQGPLKVRAVPGPEFSAFDTASRDRFWHTSWTITPDSNRIGFRLEGSPVTLQQPLEMLSHGIVPGVVQVPPQGKPIVMMRDCQTSGGYPKIATVIPGDLRKLAQAALGSTFQFERVSVAEAVGVTQRQEAYLTTVEKSLWCQTWK